MWESGVQAAQQISKFKPRMERNAALESVCAVGRMCSETFHSDAETGRYSWLYFKEQQVTFVTMLLHSRHTSLSPVGKSSRAFWSERHSSCWRWSMGGKPQPHVLDTSRTSRIRHIRAISPYKPAACSWPSRGATFVFHPAYKPLTVYSTWPPLT